MFIVCYEVLLYAHMLPRCYPSLRVTSFYLAGTEHTHFLLHVTLCLFVTEVLRSPPRNIILFCRYMSTHTFYCACHMLICY
jgi:hypothetical protein